MLRWLITLVIQQAHTAPLAEVIVSVYSTEDCGTVWKPQLCPAVADPLLTGVGMEILLYVSYTYVIITDTKCNIIVHQSHVHQFRLWLQRPFVANMCRLQCKTHHITFKITHENLISEVEQLPASLMLYAMPRTLLTPAFVELVCFCFKLYTQV